MNLSDLPPLSVEAPAPNAGERLVRWGSVIALHLVLLYGILHYSIQQDLITLPPSIAVRLMPVQEVQKPEAAPPPPKPAPPTRKAPPLAPQPVLAAKATEAPAAFAVAPQPPAPVQASAPAPVAAPKAAAPAAVTAARFDADYLHNPKPVYPSLSRRNGEEGKVLLRVKVGPEGTALELEIKQSSSYPRLDNAAREAVAKWRFIPAKRGEEAFESWVTVPIAFALTE